MFKCKVQLEWVRKHEWAVHGRPKLIDLTVCRRVLKAIVLVYQGTLMQPVGKWIHQVDDIYSEKWTWWWDEDTKPYPYINGYWSNFRIIMIRHNVRFDIDCFKQYTAIVSPDNIGQTNFNYSQGMLLCYTGK